MGIDIRFNIFYSALVAILYPALSINLAIAAKYNVIFCHTHLTERKKNPIDFWMWLFLYSVMMVFVIWMFFGTMIERFDLL